MKHLFLSLILTLCQTLTAQVTLTSSNNPAPGDIVLQVDCDTNGIAEGNSGTNQTWNFTNIILQDSSMQTWVAAGSTPYVSLFPTSNLALTDDTSYLYTTASATGYSADGLALPGTLLSYSDPRTIIEYPFTYGSSYTDDFAFTWIDSGNFMVSGMGSVSVLCDGWGTLNLPPGSFSNSIRVKYISYTEPPSAKESSGVDISYDTLYVWYVPGRKDWVFAIDYDYGFDPTFGYTRVKSVSYYPDRPTIGITKLSSFVADDFHLGQNYPNPFNPSTKIRFDISSADNKAALDVSLTVYDALGRKIETLVSKVLQTGSYEVDWNAGSNPAGVYFYKLTADGFEQTRSMILIK